MFCLVNDNIYNKISSEMSPTPSRVVMRTLNTVQSELLGQFRLISDRASDVSGGRICLTQNAYAEI